MHSWEQVDFVSTIGLVGILNLLMGVMLRPSRLAKASVRPLDDALCRVTRIVNTLCRLRTTGRYSTRSLVREALLVPWVDTRRLSKTSA